MEGREKWREGVMKMQERCEAEDGRSSRWRERQEGREGGRGGGGKVEEA